MKIFQHAATILLAATSLHAELAQEDFRNPPVQARPSAIWTWLNGHVDHKQITRNNTGEFLNCPSPNSRGLVIDHLSRDATDAHINHILWKQPFRADIGHLLKKGENHLEIVVTNLWNNRIVGDLQADSKEAFTRTNIKSKFSAKSPLLPSGLMGPVKLAFPVSVTIQSL